MSASLDFFLSDYTPKLGDTIVELGAGSVHETPELCRLVGDEGYVVAVEAHPRSFDRLAKEVGRRRNVELIWAAVGARQGRTFISDEPNPEMNRVIENGKIEVPAVMLDDLTTHLDHIDLLKVNIEGSEFKALAGGMRTLMKTDHIVVACHDFLGMKTREPTRALLEAARFEVKSPDNPTHDATYDYLFARRLD